MELRKIDVNMGLIERLRILLKYQEGNVSGEILNSRNYSMLLFFYPLTFILFWVTRDDSKLSEYVIKFLVFLGILLWIISLLLTVMRCLKINEVLVRLSTYFLGVYIYFILPIVTITTCGSGEVDFIINQELLLILYPIIWYLIMSYCMIDKNGKIRSEKARTTSAYLMGIPTLLAVMIALPLAIFYSTYFWIYLFLGIELLFSTFLITYWFIILYSLRHKDDEVVDSTAQSKVVNALNETLQNKHFGKDEIKED